MIGFESDPKVCDSKKKFLFGSTFNRAHLTAVNTGLGALFVSNDQVEERCCRATREGVADSNQLASRKGHLAEQHELTGTRRW